MPALRVEPLSSSSATAQHRHHVSEPAWAVISEHPGEPDQYVFATSRGKNFQAFAKGKRVLDRLSGFSGWRLHDLRRTVVSGMARLGVPPHVADKILNHQSGTISGVAAVYQRHEFLHERKEALDRWAIHVQSIVQTIGRQNKDQPATLRASSQDLADANAAVTDVRCATHREP